MRTLSFPELYFKSLNVSHIFSPNLFLPWILVIRFYSRIICSLRSSKIHLFQTPISTRLRLSLFEISSCTNSRLSRWILEIVFYTNTRSKAPFEKTQKTRETESEKEKRKDRNGERERDKKRECSGVNAAQPTSPKDRLEARSSSARKFGRLAFLSIQQT